MSDKYTFYLLDASWNCISEHVESEKLFIENNGLTLLFEIYERVEDYVKFLLLGFLADIGSHFKEIFVEELYIWKSENSKKSMPTLLIEKWNEISASPTKWIETTEMKLPEEAPDFKLKIFHVLNAVDFIAFDEYTFLDLSTLSEIRMYRKMQIDNTWFNIEQTLEQRGVRPTTPDEELLTKKITKRDNRRKELSSIQEQYTKKELELQKTKNEEFTSTLRESFKKPVTKKLMSITESKKKKNAMLKQISVAQDRT